MNKQRFLFPSLRCKMGNWTYYVTYFQFSDVAEWIKFAEEVHNSKKLAEWIQRRLDGKHTKGITNYLLNQSERLFNAIVVGVYGGQPEWASLKISGPLNDNFEISEEQEIELERSIGLLKLSGDEKLFAIDGQHRVAGIKKALKESNELSNEEICAIFVGHKTTPEGMERTRRLFTTLNKTAKKVANADIVALDEDDSFAVVTRRLVDEFTLLSQEEKVAFTGTTAIPSRDKNSIASIISIYQIAQDLYPDKNTIQNSDLPKKFEFKRIRASEENINKIYDINCKYWMLLREIIPEYQQVFSNSQFVAGQYRSVEKTHLLFRSVGQRAFASAVQVLMSRGKRMKDAIELIASQSLWLQDKEWHYILWNPLENKIITKNRVIAETFLLQRVGEEGKSKKNEQRLKKLIAERDQQDKDIK